MNPDNYTVRFKLGEAYAKSNMIKPAIEEYKYIAAHSNESEEALFALGDIYLKLKKYDEAIDCYNQVIKKQPRNAVAYSNRASAYAASGKREEELDSLKKAVSLNSNGADNTF